MATPIPSNRCGFRIGEIVAATGGSPAHCDPDAAVSGVCIDTRAIERGMLFVALKGARDGHDYLDGAFGKGAAAAMVTRGRAHPSAPCIEVDDTLEALGALARHHLDRVRARRALAVITIGGAAGKTTTKELTAAAARAILGPTLATPGNLNNRIGVPMTIFTLTDEHRAAVFECGTNQRGEIERLGAIVRPDASMVLNVDIEHSEGLGSLEEIADEESRIFESTRRFAIIPAHDPLLRSRIPARLNVLTFGSEADADVRLAARSVGRDGRSKITLKLNPILMKPGESPLMVSEIALAGAAMAMNCAAALAGVVAMSPERLREDQLRAAGEALAAVRPVSRRLAIATVNGMIVIDDSYNAQPPSMRAAIATAAELAVGTGARLAMVLGDMLELGALSAQSHDEAIKAALDSGAELLIAVGPEMTAALERASERGLGRDTECASARDSEHASRLLKGRLRRGDVVLVKGSLGMAMDKVVASLG